MFLHYAFQFALWHSSFTEMYFSTETMIQKVIYIGINCLLNVKCVILVQVVIVWWSWESFWVWNVFNKVAYYAQYGNAYGFHICISLERAKKARFPITWVGLADAKRSEGTLGYSRRMECSWSLICHGSEPGTKETEPEIHQIPASRSTSDRRTLPHIYTRVHTSENPLIRSQHTVISNPRNLLWSVFIALTVPYIPVKNCRVFKRRFSCRMSQRWALSDLKITLTRNPSTVPKLA